MQVIQATIECPHEASIYIHPIGDIHAGSIHCAESHIDSESSLIRQSKNHYWIGMGDYGDCITPKDPRWEVGELWIPGRKVKGIAPWVKEGNIGESQRGFLKDILMPIRGKCIALLDGNHERKMVKYNSYNLTENLVADLRVPYGGYSCIIDLKVTRPGTADYRNFTIHAWHGAGAAQTEGARLMRLVRLMRAMEADVYLMAHLHAITHIIVDRIRTIRGRLKSMMQIATITGSWLRTYTQDTPPSYGEEQGYLPSHIGCPQIIINPSKDRVQYMV